MKVIESYGKYIRWKVPWYHQSNALSFVTHFLTFLQLIMQILFDQTKERESAFGFITSTYFIFVDLCI